MNINIIKLTRGLITVVNEDRFEEVNRYKWHSVKAACNFYAATWISIKGVKRKVYLHRFLLHCYDKKQVHHKDGFTLNNLTENLEKCSQHKNLSYRQY
jgi:hypothetical protein